LTLSFIPKWNRKSTFFVEGNVNVAEWRIEPLRASHERGEFSCGKAPLDDFLRLRASQYEKRRLGRTYVALFPGTTTVAGYYTLAAGAVAIANLPPDAAKRLPKHPVPVILLGRLAVDRTARGQGLGRALLRDALHRSVELSEQIGLFAVEVLAIDAEARDFYVKYGFVPLADNEQHLFLPIKTIEEGRTEGK
jgi:GNAT superfamily N-acetyltransferase